MKYAYVYRHNYKEYNNLICEYGSIPYSIPHVYNSMNGYANGKGKGFVYKSSPYIREYVHGSDLYICDCKEIYVYNVVLCRKIIVELMIKIIHE